LNQPPPAKSFAASVRRQNATSIMLAVIALAPGGELQGKDQTGTAENEPSASASPFATLHSDENGWVFIKDGKKLPSLGVSLVQPKEVAPRDPAKAFDALTAHGGDRSKWAAATAQRLRDWNFNSLGAWSDEAANRPGLPYARVVWLGGHSGHGQRADMRLVDVFDPAYAERVAEQAREEVAPYAEDTNLLGFFINNELPFYGEFGWPTDPDKSLWDRYMALPPEAPGRQRAAEFFQAYYSSLEKAREDWEAGSWEQVKSGPPPTPKSLGAQRFKHEWAGVVADRYYAVCTEAIRRYAPNHLILGSRHAGRPPAAVARAEAKYTDVISINHYAPSGHPDLGLLRNLHALTGRPILVTEFSWRAQENRSGNSNAKGAEVTVPTQADRARAYRSYVSEWMSEPYALGAHWFQYHDQPGDGRAFDGENSNYGIVDIADRPYEELVAAMKEANQQAIAALSSRRMPAEGYVFNAETWGELMPVKLDAGPLDAPINVDLAAAGAVVKADAGNSATIAPDAGGLKATYQSGGGWGLHMDMQLPEFPAGGRNAVLRLRGTPGHRYRVFLSESGDGPPGLQTYSGRGGADGESFEYAPFVATGGVQEIRVPLGDATVRQYWGNQRGDRKVATGGLGALSIFVFPGQGSGEISVEALNFAP
jgi:hypothetical protein